ncbi:acyltransferase [Bradyrhizobium sp. WSM1253]|uniref:acyltransferase family protein n=1 Tax=Bradyrhizobium sp. WSM1253 TaxID=319003 RepID=UPI00025D185B|nr:acyltransferase [Bradyrhizobium sp. WSM1253]EIG56090.1 putative acyltransferase [Bradyrhizobium sp. WSM1253]
MGKIRSIQALRAVAANLVVLTHVWGFEQQYYPNAGVLPACFEWIGMYGVYLFFVISGFVIIRAAANEDWRQFITARLTRIYPAYWFYTAVLLAGYVVASPQRLTERASVSLLASFTLWPTAEKPLLIVGWTLTYEIYFYLIVAVMIAAGLRPLRTLVLWAGVILAAQSIPYEANPVAAVLFSPLTLLFIAGGALGLLIRPRASRAPMPYLPAVERCAVALGDASYSTYLAHFLVISVIWKLSFTLPWQTPQWALISFSLLAANAWGLISYRLIEKPAMVAVRQTKNAPDFAPVK